MIHAVYTRGRNRSAWKKGTFFFSLLLFAAVVFFSPGGQTAESIPRELEGVGVTEHLGESVDLTRIFVDEQGSPVMLQDLMKEGRPVILSLVYYECPNLCNLLMNGLTDALRSLDWTVGTNFDIVHVSINPNEKPQLAAAKRASYIKAYAREVPKGAWHFLTGEEPQIQALAKEVGFQYHYDEGEQQYAHTAVLVVLMPEGKIARYLYGIQFEPRDLKLALLEASKGKIGNVVERFLLFCYHYDPKTKKYALFATRLMQGAGAVTVLVMGSLILRARRKGRS